MWPSREFRGDHSILVAGCGTSQAAKYAIRYPEARVGGIDVGIYRVGDEIHAMEDACPHAGFPLSSGRLEGCVVVCKAHGWPFDVRTGFDPENADGFPIPCFAVRIIDDGVEVDLDAPINDPRPRRPTRSSC